jgi:hypothetical protein
MVVNIEKVSQWPRARRNHLCQGIKGNESVDNKANPKIPRSQFKTNWIKQFTQMGKLLGLKGKRLRHQAADKKTYPG